ncbi:DUF6069 family protein [Lentzea flaviverrucosa]|uniref:PEP-CTERM protein-sorting domain-containing protein n=1 Tax=Lentzea flaviverrucosa TaxID=200379 RepID=A0A1H9GQ08_9PSEU|nr:DUF6069 family protein [Lentzea flaviverrucosa]RDI34835.1 putative secreted protein with PEP-CTERM sorting signal [Lentzea flaviverrucosa]SEQ52176.1 PEP-CTERM protein-sorting domain-containing protein [Lentzea flaviverrucosa]
MADTSFPARSSVLAPSAGEVVVGLLGAAAVSIAVNALIALVAGKFVPAGTERMGLAFAEYAPATVIGVLLGTLGWYLVRRSARDPRRVLRVLVPVVVVLSWIPDLGILAGGAAVANSVALIAMHTVVAAATVPVLSRVLPLPAR